MFFVTLTHEVFANENHVSKLEGKYRDWLVYTHLDGNEKVCYVVSYHKKKNKSQYVMVNYVSKAADEVVVSSNSHGPVVLNIDNRTTYKLPIINNGLAWAENIKIDQDIVKKMKLGLSMVIKSNSNPVTYSLLGFTAAYNKMHDLCK